MTMATASLLAAFADSLGESDWLQHATEARFLKALDETISRATAVQTHALALADQSSEEQDALHYDLRVLFAVYMRATQLLSCPSAGVVSQKDTRSLRESLLHIARLVPLCRLYAPRNRQHVRALLTAVMTQIPTFHSDLILLGRVFVQQYQQCHDAVAMNKRTWVTDQITMLSEYSLTLDALTSASEMLSHLLPPPDVTTADATPLTASDSLWHALAVCYECDLPVLQRHLSTLPADKPPIKRAALLIPETRRLLLQILGAAVDHVMVQETQAGTSGEAVLAMLHALSHCTDAEPADHGSFISDLWHLCGYEAKLLNFFANTKLDRDSVSYLEVVMDRLPQRRVLEDVSRGGDEEEDSKHSVNHVKQQPTTASTSTLAPASATLAPVSIPREQVQQVQDLFPDLGDGFVTLCLLTTQGKLEPVIDFLLESNPPPVLLTVRRDLTTQDGDFAELQRRVAGHEADTVAISGDADRIDTATATKPPVTSEIVDPSRIWVGKKAMETKYDPRVAPEIVERMKQIVDEYAEEDSFRELSTSGTGLDSELDAGMVDEYDDDYNDEFDDYEPFSVHDGGMNEDMDAIRALNRRVRAQETEDAYWEGLRNTNRQSAVTNEENDEDEEKDNDGHTAATATTTSQHKRGGPHGGESKPEAAPGGEVKTQRNRQRDTKNKAKVGNHHRKDRALKKRG